MVLASKAYCRNDHQVSCCSSTAGRGRALFPHRAGAGGSSFPVPRQVQIQFQDLQVRRRRSLVYLVSVSSE